MYILCEKMFYFYSKTVCPTVVDFFRNRTVTHRSNPCTLPIFEGEVLFSPSLAKSLAFPSEFCPFLLCANKWLEIDESIVSFLNVSGFTSLSTPAKSKQKYIHRSTELHASLLFHTNSKLTIMTFST